MNKFERYNTRDNLMSIRFEIANKYLNRNYTCVVSMVNDHCNIKEEINALWFACDYATIDCDIDPAEALTVLTLRQITWLEERLNAYLCLYEYFIVDIDGKRAIEYVVQNPKDQRIEYMLLDSDPYIRVYQILTFIGERGI